MLDRDCGSGVSGCRDYVRCLSVPPDATRCLFWLEDTESARQVDIIVQESSVSPSGVVIITRSRAARGYTCGD